jgi:hypothetical protein
MKLHILEEAEQEFLEAIQYYEDINSGLGVRLKKQVNRIIHWIRSNPELPRLRPRGYRRVNSLSFSKNAQPKKVILTPVYECAP